MGFINSITDIYPKHVLLKKIRRTVTNSNLVRTCRQAEKLGTGSFSTVYRYEEIATGKSVAIKVLSDAVSRKSEKISLEQVLCELTTLGKVSHPNVLSFLGSALVDNKLFIITELIDGHDLLDIAYYHGKSLETQHFGYFIREVLKALKYLASEGIIHNDLKCANILVGMDASVKVSDFGLSKKQGSRAAMAFRGGTACAPEKLFFS